ncbi:hypothetical protein V6B95_12645 [Thermoanaerobacterium saccharolyticum]|nr:MULTISPECIES: hypothetical protein [Thermoanaerobacterium]
MNWSIKLTSTYKEVYSKDSGPSFHVDGERYHIFDFKSSDDIELSLKWNDGNNTSIESAINHVLNSLTIPNEYMPDLNLNINIILKKKEDFSAIYLVFVPDAKRLYVIENIIHKNRKRRILIMSFGV